MTTHAMMAATTKVNTPTNMRVFVGIVFIGSPPVVRSITIEIRVPYGAAGRSRSRTMASVGYGSLRKVARMDRRRVRRNRTIDGNGSLGMAAALCGIVHLRGGRTTVVPTAVDFRSQRMMKALQS